MLGCFRVQDTSKSGPSCTNLPDITFKHEEIDDCEFLFEIKSNHKRWPYYYSKMTRYLDDTRAIGIAVGLVEQSEKSDAEQESNETAEVILFMKEKGKRRKHCCKTTTDNLGAIICTLCNTNNPEDLVKTQRKNDNSLELLCK